LSFFDEADEPRRGPRPRRTPPGGGSRRPPAADHQTLLVRRLVAAGAFVVVLILLVVLIKGCVSGQREQALKDYNRNVRTLVDQSRTEVARPLFQALSGASGQQQQTLQDTLNQLRLVADEQLKRGQGLSAPDAAKQAQSDFVLSMSLRRDGVRKIADLIQQAVGRSAASTTAVNQIAGQMRAFDAADVVYSQRVAPLVLNALRSNGIAASYDGTAGERVTPQSNFLSNIGWINPTFVAQQLGASTAGSSTTARDGTPAPGLHGHQIDSVSVGGTTLDPSGSNTIPASSASSFSVTFTNGGENDETNVKVDVAVTADGRTVRGQRVVPSTRAHAQTSVDVPLSGPPPTGGPATVRVTVEPVPGERSTDNNTQTFNALFT
jgi:hypothetical protein